MRKDYQKITTMIVSANNIFTLEQVSIKYDYVCNIINYQLFN